MSNNCCIHSNTFFAESDHHGNACCSDHMYMLSITFYRSHESGIVGSYNHQPATKGMIRRTVCMPFEPSVVNAIQWRLPGDSSTLVLFTLEDGSYTISARDVHVVDLVFANIADVRVVSIIDASTKKLSPPVMHHICGIARVDGPHCVIEPKALRAGICSKGKTNINKGYVVSSTLCQVRDVFLLLR